MSVTPNIALVVAGILSAIAALLHIAVIIGGPAWYRFFGAGERMAQMAERGELHPTLVTLGITGVLGVWALYAFAGAGLIRALPLMKPALAAITAVYLLRGLAPIPIFLFRPDMMNAFWIWSSLICLGFGLAYLIGTHAAWGTLP